MMGDTEIQRDRVCKETSVVGLYELKGEGGT